MDWKLLTGTFVLIFVAELGDKTQIAAMCQAAQFQKPGWCCWAPASP